MSPAGQEQKNPTTRCSKILDIFAFIPYTIQVVFLGVKMYRLNPKPFPSCLSLFRAPHVSAAALIITTTLLLSAGCEEEPTKNEPAYGSLAGEVRDRNSAALIGKAQVRAVLNGVVDTTTFPGLIRWEDGEPVWWDTVGTFLLDNLSTGLDSVIVSRELYYAQEYLVDIAPGTNEIDFYLEPLCPYDTLVVQGWQSVRILGQWYMIDEQGRGWEVDNTEFTVKYKVGVSDEEIAALNQAMGIQVARFNKLGYYDLKVPEGADPLCTVLAYLAGGLVDYIHPNTFGYPAD